MPDESKTLIQPGRNCWRRERAERCSMLVNGDEYFRHARSAMIQARRRICLAAWEFHSQADLLREDTDDGYPTEIGPLLDALLEEKDELEVFILVWDYAFIYVAEREWSAFSDWLKNPHPRLQFVSDKTAPSGASHHQKILAIDDSIAFCGGLDLSISRWDTARHQAEDPRRVNPDGKPHNPYHDVHTLLDGDAAKALRDLFAERWRHATGNELPHLEAPDPDELWPEGLDPQFRDVEVALSRIFASSAERPTEIEQLHLDLFAAAKRFLFIENQYFSSATLCDALADRLREEDGPEIVLILPSSTSGWLVESTVGLMRDRLLELLAEADKHQRLRVYAPYVEKEDGEPLGVYVHAKVIVVDDRILKNGSSNLSNRSLSVDSELDLTLEFSEENEALKQFRHRLLGEHFGMSPEQWSEAESSAGGLLQALDAQDKDFGQRLMPLAYGCESDLARHLADTELLDPDDPIDPEFLIRKNLSEEERPKVWRRLVKIVALLGSAAALGGLIYWAWGEFLGKEKAMAFWQGIADNRWLPLIVLLTFTIGGSLGVPLNFLLVTTTLVLGSSVAILYGVSGAMISACIGFYLGHLLGKPLIRKLGSDAVDAVSRKLGERSFRSVAFIRLIPVAPFFMVNMVAGASQLKFREYALGTVLGMAPGMSAVVLLANRVEAAARQPGWVNFLFLAVVVAVLIGIVSYLKRALAPKSKPKNGEN